MNKDVFISYPMDDKVVALAVCSGLEAEGITCWIAPRDLTSAQSIEWQIVDAIEQALVLVLILSARVSRSIGVLRELEFAQECTKTFIVFRIDEAISRVTVEKDGHPVAWIDALHPPLTGKIALLAETVRDVLNGTYTELSEFTLPGQPAPQPLMYGWVVDQEATSDRARVFLCFKHSAADGQETKDSQMAKAVAAYLRQRGFPVFLSADSLEKLGRSGYTEAIEEALESADVLVAIGSNAANLNASWVKHEWLSFLQNILDGHKKHGQIFSVVDGMKESELPFALRQWQAIRFSEEGLASLSRFLAVHSTNEQ
jgi:hypothetical protein